MTENQRAVLMVAESAAQAQVLVALLRGASIATYLGGDLLQDEFAVSQRTMGLQGVTIEVARDDLERARQVVAAAKEDGRTPGRDGTSDEP